MNESTSNVNPSTDEIYLSAAQRSTMLANGYPWLPGSGKAVYLDGWQKLDVSEEVMEWKALDIPQWDSWPNTGCQLGRAVIAADNDIADKALAAKVQTALENHIGTSPCIRIGSKGQAALYRVEAPMRSIVVRGIPPGGTERKTAVEFLGLERQLMCFGHVAADPSRGQPAFNYRWPQKSPLTTPVSALPLATHGDVLAAAENIRAELIKAGWTDVRVSETATDADKDKAHGDAKKGNGGLVSLDMLKAMLACIDPGIGRKESSSWISVLGALKHAEACELVADAKTFEPDPNFDAEALAVDWSRGDLWKGGQPANFVSEADVVKALTGLSPFAAKGSTIATIVKMAREGGYTGDSRVDSLMDRFDNVADMVPSKTEFASGVGLYDPWTDYDAPVFPLDVLPVAMREFVEANSIEMGVDGAAIAMASLLTLSGAVSHEVRLKLSTTFYASPRLWVLQVGRPSSFKTPAQNVALAPLRAIHDKWQKDHRDNINRLKAENASEEIIKAAESAHAVRLLTNDVTPEKLADILSNQNRGIVVHRDELSGWIGAMDKYASGKGAAADRAVWLQAYDGGSYSVERMSRKASYVENLSVSILGGIQPARLQELAGLQSDGLLQRFLPVMLRKSTEGRKHDSREAAAMWEALVRQMLNHNGRDTVRLSAEAESEFTRIRHENYVLTTNDTLGDGFASFVGKLNGVWGSLALLLHLAWGGDTGPTAQVSGETAKRASRLLESFLIPHAYAFYENMAGDAQGDHRAIGTCIVGLLAKGRTTVKVRDLQKGPKCCQSVHAKDMAFKLLPFVAGGWLEPVSEGPWCNEWEINPAVASFEANAAEHRKMVASVREKIRASTAMVTENA